MALDRLGRSLAHLIELAAALEARSVGFRSLSEGIDTTTPGGRLVFHLFGALAEFEQALISERTQKGLEAARARGRNGGRRRVMTAERLALARTMYDSKQYPMATIAKTIGASPASIYRALATDYLLRTRATLGTQAHSDGPGQAYVQSTPRQAKPTSLSSTRR